MPRVTITVPEKSPQPYRFDLLRKIVTIGRGQDSDIVIGSGSVSGKHSEMHRVKGGYHLIDVGSTNGIKIDGIRHQTVVLHTGMTVKLGDVEFGFSLSEEEIAVLAAETEPVTKPVVNEPEDEEQDEEIGNEPISQDDDDDDDGPEKLPELPPSRIAKAKEKEAAKADKEKVTDRSEREEEPRKKEKPKKQKKVVRDDDSDEDPKPKKSRDSDEYSESRAVTVGSGFVLLALVAAAAAFFYGAHTRHEKDTGESLLKGIVNKEDAKNAAPTEVEESPEGVGE